MKPLYTYKIISQAEPDQLKASIEFNPSHRIFKGHFPNFPVVPGVCQLQIVKDLLAQHLNQKLQLTRARSIKFTHMINPLETEQVEAFISIKQNEETLSVQAVLSSAEQTYFKLKGEYHVSG